MTAVVGRRQARSTGGGPDSAGNAHRLLGSGTAGVGAGGAAAPWWPGRTARPRTGAGRPRFAGAGVLVLLAATTVVLYLVGPLVHARDQRALVASEQSAITEAASNNEGLHRAALPTQPPQPGSVVGDPRHPGHRRLHQAVVEGWTVADRQRSGTRAGNGGAGPARELGGRRAPRRVRRPVRRPGGAQGR